MKGGLVAYKVLTQRMEYPEHTLYLNTLKGLYVSYHHFMEIPLCVVELTVNSNYH